ncbi:MAG: type 4a pilus biogenesis protein PilO [Desulfuromusa sp.]|nr:type 4a pilus biogenesis protein PilO [Desulfuromusa sp.]
MLEQYPLFAAVWEQNRIRLIVLLVLLLCVLATYAGQRWVVEPDLLALRTAQSQLQQNVRQRQMEFANSGVPVSTAEQMDKNLQRFNQRIPLSTEFSVFLGDLFDWSQQAGLELHQVSYQPKQEKETGFLHYGVSFSVKGSYSQVKQFIHLLENASRILLVEKISLSGASSRKKSKEQVDLRIELVTYFQGEAA